MFGHQKRLYKELVKRICLGVEAPLWSETSVNIDEIGYLGPSQGMIRLFRAHLSYEEIEMGEKIIKVRLGNQAPYWINECKYYPSRTN